MSQQSPSEDILDLLIESTAQDIGDFAATTGWGIYLGRMPDKPDTCISIMDGPPDNKPATNYSYEYPTVQIRVRGKKGGYKTAYSKILQIRDFLHTQTNVVLSDSRYIQIICNIDIEFIGFDEIDRPIYVANFGCQRTKN